MYYSFEKKPPGVFTLENATNNQDNMLKMNTYDFGPNNTILYYSRMDLWFEDEDSADSAYEALCIKINKAKSKRGKMLIDAFSKK